MNALRHSLPPSHGTLAVPGRMILAVTIIMACGGSDAFSQQATVTNRVRLLAAITRVESGGNPRAVGSGGVAVGVLQIHPILVREANRLLGRQEFKLADRWNRRRSEMIFAVIASRWPNVSDETIARRWNGGPDGERKASTLAYWHRVKKNLR